MLETSFGTGWQMIAFFIPIIIALSGVVRITGVNTKLIPLVDIFFGVIAGILYAPVSYSISIKCLIGVLAGLGASGLYTTGKHTVEEIQTLKDGGNISE